MKIKEKVTVEGKLPWRKEWTVQAAGCLTFPPGQESLIIAFAHFYGVGQLKSTTAVPWHVTLGRDPWEHTPCVASPPTGAPGVDRCQAWTTIAVH